MHPADCPVWEYNQHPRADPVLREQAARILVELRRGGLDPLAIAADTRPLHRRLFLELIPPGHDYYAGHYRGEEFRCLRYYEVRIVADPRVGFSPGWVLGFMAELAGVVRDGLGALDAAHAMPDAHIPRVQKLIYAVMFACRVFEQFLRVHPFANGNGHAARLIVWAVLGRYGFWPKRWPLHPRPPDPPYSDLILEYRNGNCEPLEAFVLRSIASS